MKIKFSLFFAGLLLVTVVLAQEAGLPGLLIREDWNEKPPYDLSKPYNLSQADVMNADLILTLYGPGCDSLKKRHHGDASEPYYVYSGFCSSNWAIALSPKNYYFDLRGNSIIRCRIMNSGFRQIHLIIQSSSGNWFVSDIAGSPSSTWKVFDFVIKDIKWSLLNIKTVTPGPAADEPVLHYGANWLSQIDKIGFTDLMNGGLSDACSRIDWVEVYAKTARR